MRSPRYKNQKYEVGQRLLTLRVRTRLTQIDLAGLIGVNRRSIQKWQGGATYPKEDHLQRLIAVFLERSAFTPGREREEAEALWVQVSQYAPRPLPRFDVPWFERLLDNCRPPTRSASSGQTAGRRGVLDAPLSPATTAGSTQGQSLPTHREPPTLERA